MEINAEESKYEKAHIQEGIHHAELVEISDAPDGKYGARVALDFVVFYNKNEKPVKIGRIFGKILTPKSHLWGASEALGGKPEVGKKFNMDTLLGNPCRVMVEDYEDGDGKTVSGISKVKAPDENTVEYLSEAKEARKTLQDENPKVEEEKVN